MATMVERTSNEKHDEKQDEKIEHIEQDRSPSLSKSESFDIDVENKRALKGDASDGKVDWTTKQIIATISLAMIYTGKPSHHSNNGL